SSWSKRSTATSTKALSVCPSSPAKKRMQNCSTSYHSYTPTSSSASFSSCNTFTSVASDSVVTVKNGSKAVLMSSAVLKKSSTNRSSVRLPSLGAVRFRRDSACTASTYCS